MLKEQLLKEYKIFDEMSPTAVKMAADVTLNHMIQFAEWINILGYEFIPSLKRWDIKKTGEFTTQSHFLLPTSNLIEMYFDQINK